MVERIIGADNVVVDRRSRREFGNQIGEREYIFINGVDGNSYLLNMDTIPLEHCLGISEDYSNVEVLRITNRNVEGEKLVGYRGVPVQDVDLIKEVIGGVGREEDE